MNYDDGQVGIFTVANISVPGKKPTKGLTLVSSFRFGYADLGINRYYTALEAKQQIAAVVNIPGWEPGIEPDVTVAVIADADGSYTNGVQYTVRMVQPNTDDFGLRSTRLSLERINERYDVLP